MVTSGAPAWEQRWHPLREEWVVVAAHRQDRPWQGERATVSPPPAPEYVESCYFCPRNVRVGGARNPDYQSVFVFDNDHPCVGRRCAPLAGAAGRHLSERAGHRRGARGLLHAEAQRDARGAAGRRDRRPAPARGAISTSSSAPGPRSATC